MVLGDTSVWVKHLRDGESVLEDLLEEGHVMCHPFIVGELACGNLKYYSLSHSPGLLPTLSGGPFVGSPSDSIAQITLRSSSPGTMPPISALVNVREVVKESPTLRTLAVRSL